MLVLTQPLILDGSRQRAEEMKQSSCDNITSTGIRTMLYLQSPTGAPEPGGRCTFDRPQPPAWIESDPAVVSKQVSSSRYNFQDEKGLLSIKMQAFTFAVSDTLSQYGRGNSSCPIRI